MATANQDQKTAAITPRAIVLGLLLAATACALTPYNDYGLGATSFAGNQFPLSAVFTLFMLGVPINALLRWLRPALAFRRGELLTVWALILVSSGIPASGMMRTFIPNIAAPAFYSTTANRWEERVWGKLPPWLLLQDADAARAFFAGYPRGHEHIPWAAWIPPLLAWGLFGAFLFAATFCFAAILRRQWVENERFAFPLVQLPLLIAEDPPPGSRVAPLFRSPLLWIAAALAFTFHGFRALHQLYPTVPDIPNGWLLQNYLTTRPWDQIGSFPALIYPMVLGITYLLPTEVSLSLWLFFLVYKGEIILCALYNWDMPGPLGGHSNKLFAALQAFGGALGLALWTLWTARHHLRTVWAKATGSAKASVDDSGELLPYRAAVWGLLVAYAGMVLWLLAAGVPLMLALLTLVMATLAFIVIGWVTCQAGMLFMAMPWATIDIVGPTLGTASLDTTALYTQFRAEGPFIYNTRDMLFPSVLSAAKALAPSGTGSLSSAPLRRLTGAMVVSVAVGVIVSAIGSLWTPYYHGGGNAQANNWTYSTGPQIPLAFFGGAASTPYRGSWTNLLHILGGFVAVLGLLVLRAQVGVGLHPIGILTASVYSTHMLWFTFFLGWAAKTILLRYGGLRLYNAAFPFFVGLILGDVLAAAVWIILGSLTQVGYYVPPP